MYVYTRIEVGTMSITRIKMKKLDWLKHKDVIQDMVVLEVDGSVNKNPGHFGIVGVYNPSDQTITAYKYKGNRLTNQLLEMLAIYHGLETFQLLHEHNNEHEYSEHEYRYERKCAIVSDSLTTINILVGIQNVRNPRLVHLKQLIEQKIDSMSIDNVFTDIYLVYRRGHTRHDYVGKYITNLVKYYNRTNNEPDIEYGLLQSLIEQLQW